MSIENCSFTAEPNDEAVVPTALSIITKDRAELTLPADGWEITEFFRTHVFGMDWLNVEVRLKDPLTQQSYVDNWAVPLDDIAFMCERYE